MRYDEIVDVVGDFRPEWVSGRGRAADEFVETLQEKFKVLRVPGNVEKLAVDGYSWLPFFKQKLKSFDFVDFARSAAKSYPTQGSYEFCNFFDEAQVKTNGSFYLPSGVNFILVQGGAFDYFIIQSVSSIDGIFLPHERLLINFMHSDLRQVADFFAFCIAHRDEVSDYIDCESYGFFGFVASHGRPYHYLYEIAPYLLEFSRDVRLIYPPGASFLRLGAIFNAVGYDCELGFSDVFSGTILNRSAVFLIGVRFSVADMGLIEKFDQALLSVCPMNLPVDYVDDVVDWCRGALVVWVGVTSQKREWLNQVEGLTSALNVLANRFHKLKIVVDGWTAPVTPTAHDRKQIASDMGVVAEICKGIDPSISVKVSVGLKPLEKIFLASRVDAFIANSSTGSIYVSRFCRKPGVVHSNSKMRLSGHIHYGVTEVDTNLVIDQSVGARTDLLSYSIEVHGFVRQVEEWFVGRFLEYLRD